MIVTSDKAVAFCVGAGVSLVIFIAYVAVQKENENMIELPSTVMSAALRSATHDALENLSVEVDDVSADSEAEFYSRYTWANGSQILKGKPFAIRPELLESLGLPMSASFTKLNADTVKDFVFATATDASHFEESKDAVSLAQLHFPNHTIYYYDLGLHSSQIQELKTWCHVIYRRFNYTRYPSHVRYLVNYSFKPLIIQHVLRNNPAIMWMDASFRLKTSELQPVYDMVIANSGVAMFKESPHSVFAATDPKLWDYLVSDPIKLQTATMYGANSMFLFKTKKVYDGILHWFFLCALDEECIAPLWSSNICQPWPDMRTFRLHNCHRQDQSVINTLVANLYNFDTHRYVPTNSSDFVVVCKTNKVRKYNPRTCEQSEPLKLPR